MQNINIGIIGLDTTHTTVFTKIMMDDSIPDTDRVSGMKVISCFRHTSLFQSEEEQDNNQKYLEQLGVKITNSLDEALADTDAVMILSNNQARYLDLFKQICHLGKPVYIDKVLADNEDNANKIIQLANKNKTRAFCASSLRFAPQTLKCIKEMSDTTSVTASGPLVKAPTGSSLVWYGIHTIEMLRYAVNEEALKISATENKSGINAIVEFKNNKKGILQFTHNNFVYSLSAQNKTETKEYTIETKHLYKNLIIQIRDFFMNPSEKSNLTDSLKSLIIIKAIERSLETGKEEKIN